MDFNQFMALVFGVVAFGAICWALGSHDANQRPVHFTANQSNTNTATGGSGGGSASQVFGLLVPLVGLGALAVVAVSAISSGAQSSANVSAVSQQALQAQADVVKTQSALTQQALQSQSAVIQSLPKTQPAIVTQPSAGPSLLDIAALAVMAVNLALSAVVVYTVVSNRRLAHRTRQIVVRRKPIDVPKKQVDSKPVSAREVFGAVEVGAPSQELPNWIRLP